MGNLKFGDKSTKDLDLVIQSPPSYTFPEKDVELQHVPGRNGDIIIDKKCYKNVERSYSVASVFKPGTDFISNSEKIIEWLTSQPGYQRLEDSYDQEVYRLAQFKNSGSLTNYYDEATALNITFDCKPQRYLKSGEVKQEYTGNTITITNPTAMTSLPEIELSNFDVDADHILMFTIENYNHDVESMVIISVPNLYDLMIIDSENQVVYNKDGDNITNLSEYVHFNGLDFPTLSKSDNYINIKKYIKNEKYVEKYSTLIDNNQDTAFCLYKPYETLVEIAQDSVDLKSYAQLIENSQEIYDAEAYSSLCMDKSHKIEFESFNDRIQRNSTVINFNSNDFAKPMYGSVPIKRYQKGNSRDQLVYQIGDIVVVQIDYDYRVDSSYVQNHVWISVFYKFYVCNREFIASGTEDDSVERRIASGDLVPLNNTNADYEYHIEGDYAKWTWVAKFDEHFPGYWNIEPYPYNMFNIINDGYNACPSQTNPVYYWDKTPEDISLPIISEDKQLVIIARLEKNNENDSDYTKTNYSYIFLYHSEFTEITDPRKIDGQDLIRHGAFIRIVDNDDDKLSMNTIVYINCIDDVTKTDILSRSHTPSSINNSANIFYNNKNVNNNIIDIHPDFKNAIGKGHNCSIILYKAKWVYDSDDDHIGHPELDIDVDYDNSIISENVLYNRVNNKDLLPSMLINAENYDESVVYHVGGYCIHDNFYHRCLEAGTTGAWDPSKWQLDLYPIANGDEVNSVQYVTKQSGYYYKENKTGIISSIFGNIFNKNGWSHVESDKILESIEWSKKEKQFKYESGLTSTADYSISRSFIPDNNMPQYDDIIIEDTYVEDENGNVVTDSAGNKINKTIKARFQISEIDDTIKDIKKIMPKYTGFYKIQDGSGNPIGDNSWKACTENVAIDVEYLKMKAIKAYRFLFIDKAPTYQNEEDFPEWLDIYPVLYTQNGTIIPENSDLDRLNAYYYDLKVTKTAFYRYYFFDNNIKNRTEWSIIDEGNVIGQLSPDSQVHRSVNDVVTINEIDKLEDSDIFPVTQFVYMSHEPEVATDTNVYVPIVNLETAQYLLYNTAKVYNKNDVCIRDSVPVEGQLNIANRIFKCLEDNVTGAWDSSKWEEIGIPFIVPNVYSKDEIYTTNSICLYNKSIYLCVANTTITGDWDPTKWTKLGNFIKDFGFYYMAENSNEEIEYPANIPPEWLVVKVLTGTKSDDSDTTLQYYVGNQGTFKWDSNLEWKYMTVSDDPIVTSNIKNDTRIYYLENLPQYDTDQIYDFSIITSASGNPEHVEIKVKEAGYYKIKTEPNYKYLKANTTLTKITIYENPDIIRLVDDTGDSLDNLKTYIIPRWWKL